MADCWYEFQWPKFQITKLEKSKQFRSRAAQALASRVSIWNLRFVWNLMLGIWDFIDSVLALLKRLQFGIGLAQAHGNSKGQAGENLNTESGVRPALRVETGARQRIQVGWNFGLSVGRAGATVKEGEFAEKIPAANGGDVMSFAPLQGQHDADAAPAYKENLVALFATGKKPSVPGGSDSSRTHAASSLSVCSSNSRNRSMSLTSSGCFSSFFVTPAASKIRSSIHSRAPSSVSEIMTPPPSLTTPSCAR